MRMVSNSADDAIEITTVSEAVLDNLATVTNAQLGDAVRRLTLEARRRARADEALAGQLAQLAALPPITPNPEGTE